MPYFSGIMVIVVGYGIGDQSSNPATNTLAKIMIPSLLSAMDK